LADFWVVETYERAVRRKAIAVSETRYREIGTMFRSISDYEDSAEQAAECMRIADQLHEVALRHRKRDLRVLTICLSLVLVLTLGLCGYHFLYVPWTTYRTAEDLLAAGQYLDAEATFKSLDGFMDSEERAVDEAILNHKYELATGYLEKGEKILAASYLIQLGDYKDCKSLIDSEISGLFVEGNNVTFGHYEQDNNLDNGKEAIEWRVLEVTDEYAMLLSEYGLDTMPYHYEWKIKYWETSDIRAGLNGEFYQAAFTPEEQHVLALMDISTPDNEVFHAEGGADTQDKVFLLSLEEYLRFFEDPLEGRVFATPYALAKGTQADYDTGVSRWWLRSPGYSPLYGAVVDYYGNRLIYGLLAELHHTAVRPVICINLG